MNKGYTSVDIIEQCQRLDAAGIHYSFFYLVSISGAGRGEIGAKLTANICNQIHPMLIGANMLTIYPNSELFAEIQRGNWQEEGELEKYKEIRTLIENLRISTIFAAMGASNAFQFYGQLPKDKKKLLVFLNEMQSGIFPYAVGAGDRYFAFLCAGARNEISSFAARTPARQLGKINFS